MNAPPSADQKACAEVPLLELLRRVPIDARHPQEYYAPLYGTQWHPVGSYCHRAADEIEKARADLELLARSGCRVREYNGRRFVEIESDPQP